MNKNKILKVSELKKLMRNLPDTMEIYTYSEVPYQDSLPIKRATVEHWQLLLETSYKDFKERIKNIDDELEEISILNLYKLQ